MGYRLIVNDGGRKRTYPLGDEVVSIGRASDNTIPLKETGSSRHHCQVSPKGGAFYVQDLGSRNGTLVNKEAVTDHELEDGDVIQVGKSKIVFMAGAATPSSSKLELMPDDEEEAPKKKKRKSRTTRRNPVDTKARTRKASLDELGIDPERADSGGLAIEGEEEEDGLLPGLDEPYYMIWYKGSDEKRFTINTSLSTIGRLESNTIACPGEESISGKHAELHYSDGTFTLKDRGSTNGTKVNGISITEHTIKSGDLIEFGRVHFSFRNESFEESEELPTMTGMKLPEFESSYGPAPASGGGALKFLLPFIGTLSVIVLAVAGLTFYAVRSGKSAPPPVPVVQGNLIADYSFEVVEGDKPIGWKLGGQGISAKKSSDAPSGKRVLVIEHSAQKQPVLEASFDRTIPIKPFLHYKVQAKVRHAKGEGYAALRIQWLSSKDPYYVVEDYVGLSPAKSGWQEIGGSYTAPAAADYARVACIVVGPAEGAEFDDVQMFEAEKGIGIPRPLETPEGKVQIDRSGLLTVIRGKSEQVLTRGRLMVVDEEGLAIYDQALLKLSGAPTNEGGKLELEGSMPHLRGGPALPVKLVVSRYAQGFTISYRLEGSKIEGASVRFQCVTDELDAASAMAVETEGNFEMLRGEFVRPQVSLFTWKGRPRHLGLYPDKPVFVRYSKGTKIQLGLFAPMTDNQQFGFKLRLDFAEDQAAMDRAFKAAYAEKDAGRMGGAYRKFGLIIRTYPFIDGANKARKALARIEEQAADELKQLRLDYDRCRFFGRSGMLLAVRQRVTDFRKRYEGMAVVSKGAELEDQVTNALVGSRSREKEAEAGSLLQRADDFREAKMLGLAVTFYRRIVESCPGTPQAKKAAQALKELGQ